jgi:hypothetical protein
MLESQHFQAWSVSQTFLLSFPTPKIVVPLSVTGGQDRLWTKYFTADVLASVPLQEIGGRPHQS